MTENKNGFIPDEKTISYEKMKGVLVDKMSNSAEMVKNPIKDGELGYDKVFIMASKISHDGNGKWKIKIDTDDATVVLDNKWKETLKLDKSPTVGDLRGGTGEKMLVSGGTWIWMEDGDGNKFLSLLRRDKDAPVDKNCLTGPAGRCGEKLSQTTIDETNQEFMFLQIEGDNRKKLLAFYRDEGEVDIVRHQKLRQIEDVRKALMDKYDKTGDEKCKKDANYLIENIRSENDLEMVKLGDVEDKDQNLDEISMVIDGEVVDTVKGIAYMDEKNHTLEVREVVSIRLRAGAKVAKIMDGEVFLRDTMTVAAADLKELEEDDLVPALRNYIEKQTDSVK